MGDLLLNGALRYQAIMGVDVCKSNVMVKVQSVPDIDPQYFVIKAKQKYCPVSDASVLKTIHIS